MLGQCRQSRQRRHTPGREGPASSLSPSLSLLAAVGLSKRSAASTSGRHTREALRDTAHLTAVSALPCALDLAAGPAETLGFHWMRWGMVTLLQVQSYTADFLGLPSSHSGSIDWLQVPTQGSGSCQRVPRLCPRSWGHLLVETPATAYQGMGSGSPHGVAAGFCSRQELQHLPISSLIHQPTAQHNLGGSLSLCPSQGFRSSRKELQWIGHVCQGLTGDEQPGCHPLS